jgi:DNA-binding NtrC family response regulator
MRAATAEEVRGALALRPADGAPDVRPVSGKTSERRERKGPSRRAELWVGKLPRGRAGATTGMGRAQGHRSIRNVLVVAEDPWLRRALERAVGSVFACNVKAMRRLSHPLRRNFDVVILDLDRLSSASADALSWVVAKRPRPITLILAANAPPRAAFELGKLGIEAFLQKPFELQPFRLALAEATNAERPSLELLGRSWVGRVELRAAEGDLRRGMVEQALELAHGNMTRAAAILAVSRQSLQRVVRGRKMGGRVGRE